MENPNYQPESEQEQPELTVGESYTANSRPSRRGYYTVIALLILLTVAAFFVRSRLIRIHYVEVSGLKTISRQEVIDLAGITGRSTYFSLSEEKIRQRIAGDYRLQFLGMEKIWPDGVILYLKERTHQANLINKGVQYMISADGMVLDSTNNIALDNGCVKVTGMEVRDIRIGAPVVCKNVTQMEALQNLLEELDLQGVLNDTAELNLSSLESIYLVTVDGYTANLGNADDLRAKIGTVRAVTAELRRRELKGGIIEATVPGQASYRPLQ